MSEVKLYEGPAPATPPAGVVTIYAKIDGKLYWKADDGTETPFYNPVLPGFVQTDGTTPLTANWDAGAFVITALRFASDVPTGTPPFAVASTTVVPNLNADLLDGLEATAFQPAGTYLTTNDIDTLAELNAIIVDATLGDSGDFATAAQGALADTALQTADVDPMAFVQTNLSASAEPTPTDDTNAGYSVGSSWWDTTNDLIYLCIDATATAAVWVQVGSGGGMTVTPVKTANYTAEPNEVVPVDTSGGAFTITLPAAGVLAPQDRVIIVDVGKACSTYACTIGRNSNTIDGVAEDFILDQNHGRWDGSYDTGDWSAHLIGVPEVININDFATGFGGVNAQTGTTYTFADSDLALLVTASNAAASAYDIPDGLAAVGETLNLLNIGAGTVTIAVPGTDTLGSTLNDVGTGKGVTIVKTAATTWWVVGGA